MADQDLTPDLSLLSAEHEVVFAPSVNANNMNQPIGGFMASPGALKSGNISFNGTNEQILVGAVTAPHAGKGVFIGNAGDGTYDFFAGDAAGHYIWWDASTNTLTVNGDVSVTSLNIPDTTTANSFHTDATGNSWWGSNVAAGYAGATAYILATGAAAFKNVLIGGATTQYQISDNGYYTYGDGSNSFATCDGSTAVAGMSRSSSTYTLTRDVYFTNLTVNSGVTLITSGYRLFASGTLTNNGTIDYSGKDGSDGGTGGGTINAGGFGGTALPDGYLKGSVAGIQGGQGNNGSGTNGVDGTSVSNSLGSSGAAGGNSGGNSGGGGPARIGGGGGTATPSNVKLIANWHLFTLLDVSSSGSTVKFNTSAGAGAGAGGGELGGGVGGGGGGSGSPGGTVAIYARILVNGATGAITAKGGKGGKGGDATGPAGQGGGGGGGANGGNIILVYNQLTNSGAISASKGLGGSAGASGGGTPQAATAGGDGVDGTIFQFQMSL